MLQTLCFTARVVYIQTCPVGEITGDAVLGPGSVCSVEAFRELYTTQHVAFTLLDVLTGKSQQLVAKRPIDPHDSIYPMKSRRRRGNGLILSIMYTVTRMDFSDRCRVFIVLAFKG